MQGASLILWCVILFGLNRIKRKTIALLLRHQTSRQEGAFAMQLVRHEADRWWGQLLPVARHNESEEWAISPGADVGKRL